MCIWVAWIGYYINASDHASLEYDKKRISPPYFQLTSQGEPIAVSQHVLRHAKNTKIRVMLFQDDPYFQSRLDDLIHLDKSATLNDCMSEYESVLDDPSYGRTFIFVQSDLANKIFDLFSSKFKKGLKTIAAP
jgi:hypothetical protein